MKRRINLVFSLLLLVLAIPSCKEDDEPSIDDKSIDNRPPEEVVATLTENLATADSLSAFTEALKTIDLSQEEVSQGLTIFAPLNGATDSNSRKSANSKTSSSKDGTDFTDEELRDYIIKGVLKLADLSDGTIIVSLSGKTYKITKIDDQIWINGVLILPKEILSSSTETVFAVKKLLSNTEQTDEPTPATTTIEITVWDASKWSPENPKGVLAAAADVVLYRSHDDYTNSEPAYQLKATGEDGKVVFTDVEPGTYYVEVSKDTLSNIFGESEEPVNGLYVGIAAAGIFQTQEEVDNSSQENAAVGKLRWFDANEDALINEDDQVPLPYESVTVADNSVARLEILIEAAYEEEAELPLPELSEGEIGEKMTQVKTLFSTWHPTLAVIDGILSDDASDGPVSDPAELDNFGFNPNTQAIAAIWSGAYSMINDLNLIIANEPTDVELLGNAVALRAYIYLKLTTYFGGLPIHTQYAHNTDYYSSPRAEQSEVIDFVMTELEQAKSNLPDQAADKSQLDAFSVNAILARAALLAKDYAAVFEHTQGIIYSSPYSLAESATAVADEALWNSSDDLAVHFENYFGHASLPYIRLTEVHLMRAEAGINLWGDYWEEAVNIMNDLLARKGAPGLNPPLSQEELTAELDSLWKAEMPKEGNRFANLVRWEIAGETLVEKGFTPSKHSLLPIPQAVIDSNMNIFQNPGY